VNVAVNRQKIGQAFHRQAEEYDQHALVQQRIVARLDQLVASYQTNESIDILDIGCGTGAMLSALQARYNNSCLYGIDLAFNMARLSAKKNSGCTAIVNGDAEHLPFMDKRFDLVVSASTFQWLDSLDKTFLECRRVMKEDGIMCVAFFGGKTLWELQECYRDAVIRRYGRQDARIDRLHSFKGVADVHQALKCYSSDAIMITVEKEVQFHASVPELLRSIKAIGAATALSSETTGGLGWRGILNDVAETYHRKHEKDGLIPATYEVVYVVTKQVINQAQQ
jgi:malonyl-CoA O-methyltransferase